MSLFTVTLNNAVQGALDVYPVSGVMTQPTASLQRTVYINGPHRTNRELHDGDQFTDCNYYKRFCAYDATTNPGGVTDPAQVILVCTTDDGSIWDDTTGGSTGAPRVYAFDSTDASTGGWSGTPLANGAGGTTYASNVIDVLSNFGGYAQFCQIQNLSSNNAIQVRLNGSTNAVFTVAASGVQIFDKGDLLISKIEICAVAGSGNVVNAQLIFGLAAQSNS